MIGRGLIALAVLSNCVLSLPLTPSQLENEDVKVIKCIVEALADVLSRPHPMPVSQDCLVTLKTDDRLVSILRHHNFLRELQEIALQGGQERGQRYRGEAAPDPTTQTPQPTSDIPDRSMLEALGGPGERSILSENREEGNEEGGKDESREDEESLEDDDVAEAKRENDKKRGSHGSKSVSESGEGRAERGEGEEYQEKGENSEENITKEKKGAGSDEKRNVPRTKLKKRKFDREEEKDKRSALFSHKQEEKHEEEGGEGETKRGAKRGKELAAKIKAVGTETQEREVPHHSKEVSEEEEKQRSPEEKELQMIARRRHEEKRGSEEEGSASRKSEDQEIESLAAIESELENAAQKLHELRRG